MVDLNIPCAMSQNPRKSKGNLIMSKTIPGRQLKQFIVKPKGFVIC